MKRKHEQRPAGEPADQGEGSEAASKKRPSGESSGVIRVDADIARMIGIVSAVSGVPIAEIASPILREAIRKLFAEALAKAGEMLDQSAQSAQDTEGENQ